MTDESPYERAIRLGGEWFLNNQDSSFVHYRYDPVKDRTRGGHHSARELGAFWSIAKLASFLEDPRYGALSRRGLDYFLPYLRTDSSQSYLFLGITPKKIKLSYNAFLVLSLLALDHPGALDHLGKETILAGLVKGILAHQRKDGGFDTFFFSDRASGVDYYPGQSLLALAHYQAATGQEACARAAARALPFYRAYWRDTRRSAFVSWQAQAYYEHYLLSKDAAMADFVFELSDAILVEIRQRNSETDARIGLGIVAAVFVEGLNRAYQLAGLCGEDARKARYAQAVRDCLSTVIALQAPFPGQNPEDLPKRAVGGFISRYGNPIMRVDNNQHGVMALMAACEIGLKPFQSIGRDHGIGTGPIR